MPECFFCRGEIEIKTRVMRKDVCPHCGRDLHCCLQCRFHDTGFHNQCREPKAEMVRDRDRANLCDYFEFQGARGGEETSQKDEAKKRLDDLFRKK